MVPICPSFSFPFLTATSGHRTQLSLSAGSRLPRQQRPSLPKPFGPAFELSCLLGKPGPTLACRSAGGEDSGVGVQGGRGHSSILKFLGQASCYRRELLLKEEKLIRRKKRERSPASRTCLLLGYLISAEEAGAEARFLLAVSKRNSGFAFDLASPEHEALKSARCFDGAAQDSPPPTPCFLLQGLKFPLGERVEQEPQGGRWPHKHFREESKTGD